MKTLPTHIPRITTTEVINGYTGAKKRKYKMARAKLEEGVSWRAAATISMFVKPDRYSAVGVTNKAPRAIQFRKPTFNLTVARYLKPYEHAIYQSLSPVGLKQVAKGQNNVARATNIVDASALFEQPAFVLLDHSKFDSCVNVDHLKFLHKCYHQANPSKFLQYLLRFQLRNRGYSAKGNIRYVVDGTRMSGDFDTGLGNTLLNLYLIHVVFRRVRHHRMLDGDDGVVVLRKSDLKLVDFSEFKKLGFDTKISVVDNLNDVEFCRARLMLLDPPRFARDPIRALSNMTISNKFYPGEGRRRYLAGLGVGEASASNGVPIIGPIAYKLSQLSDKPILDENIQYMYGAAGDALDITDEARVQFYDIYGWSPAAQQLIEKSYKPSFWVSTQKLITYYESLPLDASDILPI